MDPSWWGSTSGLPRATSTAWATRLGLHRAARRRRDPAQPPERGAVGTAFGVDFNPTVDRLRIVSDTGQNLRADVDDSITRRWLAQLPGPPAPRSSRASRALPTRTTTRTPAPRPRCTTSTPTSTRSPSRRPPNSGSLSPTGTLRLDASDQVGFDIYSEIERGTTVRLDSFAALTVDGRSRLYAITLFSGKPGRSARSART